MSTTKYVILLILLFFITGCGLQSNWTLPTLTAPPTPHSTSTPVPLPDLEIISVEVNPPEGEVCYDEETDLETSVVIQNTGSGPAGSFVIAYNEEQHLVVEELAAGGRVTLTLPGFVANAAVLGHGLFRRIAAPVIEVQADCQVANLLPADPGILQTFSQLPVLPAVLHALVKTVHAQ